MKKPICYFSKPRKRSLLFILSTKLTTIITFFVVLAGCQKLSSYESKFSEEFTPEAAKEWYYEVFKKSDEFKNSLVKGKQLPDWSRGTQSTVGKFEIVEFPLNTNQTFLRLYNNSNLTQHQINKIFTASQKRIVFIRSEKHNIVVREVDYVPDWTYLEKKNFDISNIKYYGGKNDFDGLLSVKNWGGSLLNIHRVRDGNSYIIRPDAKERKSNIVSTQIRTDSYCPPEMICLFSQECDFELRGDVWVNVGNCSEPENTGICDVFPGDCPPDELEPEDPCSLYELNCPETGVVTPSPEDCENNRQAAQEQLVKIFDDYVDDEISSSGFGLNKNFTGPFYQDIKSWNVVKGLSNNWRIVATTKVTVTKDNPGVNANKTLLIEYLDSRYDGSNDFIITTWENPQHFETYNHNHSPTPTGTQLIMGTVRHKMKANVKVKYESCEYNFTLGKEVVKLVQNQLWVW